MAASLSAVRVVPEAARRPSGTAASPIRSSPKVAPSEVTEPLPPSDFSRMSSLYVRPLVTTVPDSRTASAELGGRTGLRLDLVGRQLADPVRARVRVLAAPRQQPRPRHHQSAHRAHQRRPTGTALGNRSHRWGCLSSRTRAEGPNGVRQRTGARTDRTEPVRPDRPPGRIRSGRASLKPTRAGNSEQEATATPRTAIPEHPYEKEAQPWQRAPPGSSSRTSPASPSSTRTATRWAACAIWSSCCASGDGLPGCSDWSSNSPRGAASSCP